MKMYECQPSDPSLYDYVRDNWEGFGPSWLFSKRVSEEESWVTQQDIDQAWQVRGITRAN